MKRTTTRSSVVGKRYRREWSRLKSIRHSGVDDEVICRVFRGLRGLRAIPLCRQDEGGGERDGDNQEQNQISDSVGAICFNHRHCISFITAHSLVEWVSRFRNH